MINKWLDKLEEKLNSDYDEYYCGVATTLFTLGYPMDPTDVWCIDCDEDNQKLCKAKAQEIIAKIREEWEWYQVELAHKIKLALENKQAIKEEVNKQTVKPMELDALYSLKDKLVEKYNVLFNKYELTEVEQGELRATTEMLYSIDDIVEKQAINEETSDIQPVDKVVDKTVEEVDKVVKNDNVDHPTHYKVHKNECIDEMVAVFGVEAVKHFCMCNAWKYRYRSSAKNGEEDLAKADWYINKLIELDKEENGVYWE